MYERRSGRVALARVCGQLGCAAVVETARATREQRKEGRESVPLYPPFHTPSHTRAHVPRHPCTTQHPRQVACHPKLPAPPAPLPFPLQAPAPKGGGRAYSLGSLMMTWSPINFLGPLLPVGSCGNMIWTLTPNIPCLISTWRMAVST